MDFTISVYLLYTLFICQVSAQSTRLYDIQLDDVDQTDDNIFVNTLFTIEKYNQTTNVMNGKISLLQDIPSETTVHIIGYEKRGNDYQPSMIDMVMNICEFLEEKHVKKIFLTKSDFPKICVASQGDYNVTNMIVESDDLPKQIVGKFWMMEFILEVNDNTIADIKIYATIDRSKAAKSNKKRPKDN